MKKIKFTKMHGAGNDYIYVDCRDGMAVENPELLARAISDKHFGVGADGLVLIMQSAVADVRMRMFNSDGSEAEMCGNAVRCIAKYVFYNGGGGGRDISLETLAGIKYLSVLDDGNVRVDMGEPILDTKQIPVDSDENFISMNGNSATAVGMGNPHAVIFMDNVAELDLEKIGPSYEKHILFPKKTNTEFIKIIDDENIEMRVWERGAGETLACGTGACAAVVACVLNNKTARRVNVHLRGGDLFIEWNAENNRIYMTGGATTICTGEFYWTD